MPVQVVVIQMKQRKGLAQIYELFFLPADDDFPEYLHIEDEGGKHVLAVHSHYTSGGVSVFKEITMQDGDTH